MLSNSAKGTIPILMYHSISQHATPKFKPFAVSPVKFAEQMAYLHRHAFTPITVTQLAQALSQVGTPLPERPVVITFDDGFADFFTEALPVLMRYNFTATLYVTTGFINGTSGWLRHEGEASRPMLTWQQLAEICAQGIECGSHSHSHPQLDTLPLPVAIHEIVQSKKLIEEHLGVAVTSFAYPFGYYTIALQKQVQAAGYTSACAVKFALSSPSTDPFALARLMIEADTTIEDFAALLHRGSSSVARTMYIHARTPVWQVMRRSSAAVKRHLSEGVWTQ